MLSCPRFCGPFRIDRAAQNDDPDQNVRQRIRHGIPALQIDNKFGPIGTSPKKRNRLTPTVTIIVCAEIKPTAQISAIRLSGLMIAQMTFDRIKNMKMFYKRSGCD